MIRPLDLSPKRKRFISGSITYFRRFTDQASEEMLIPSRATLDLSSTIKLLTEVLAKFLTREYTEPQELERWIDIAMIFDTKLALVKGKYARTELDAAIGRVLTIRKILWGQKRHDTIPFEEFVKSETISEKRRRRMVAYNMYLQRHGSFGFSAENDRIISECIAYFRIDYFRIDKAATWQQWFLRSKSTTEGLSPSPALPLVQVLMGLRYSDETTTQEMQHWEKVAATFLRRLKRAKHLYSKWYTGELDPIIDKVRVVIGVLRAQRDDHEFCMRFLCPSLSSPSPKPRELTLVDHTGVGGTDSKDRVHRSSASGSAATRPKGMFCLGGSDDSENSEEEAPDSSPLAARPAEEGVRAADENTVKELIVSSTESLSERGVDADVTLIDLFEVHKTK